MPLYSYMKTSLNKRLLISESRGDSNRCTPYKKNLTNMPHAFHAQSALNLDHIYLMWSAYSNLSWVINSVGWVHCSWEKVLSTPTLNPPQFLSQHNYWSSVLKPSICWWQTTRLTGPISPVCDQYVQYLLAGANPSVINWHRRGLQSWRCQLATSHSLTFPTKDPLLST
jgi:hypothetical protein